jgi:hypothetical protein
VCLVWLEVGLIRARSTHEYTFPISIHYFNVSEEIAACLDFLLSASITSTHLPYCSYFPPPLFGERTSFTSEERLSTRWHIVKSKRKIFSFVLYAMQVTLSRPPKNHSRIYERMVWRVLSSVRCEPEYNKEYSTEVINNYALGTGALHCM